MTLPELVPHHQQQQQQRFSVNSCATDDSIESSVIATPRDASPRHQQFNRFSIIRIVNDDPHPEVSIIPAVASTIANRRRAQTLPESTVSQALTVIPKPKIMGGDDDNNNEPQTSKSGSKLRKLWPRIKRMMTSKTNSIIPAFQESSKMKQLLESMQVAEKKPESKEHKMKTWLGKNKARVGPQR